MTDTPPTGASPTPLRRVGEFVVPPSPTTGGPFGPFGHGLVTGGALSADGRVAAVRTYTDAWLFPVTGATAEDVVDALHRTPVDVPLPDEPQGEAIAFTPDGTLLSTGEAGRSRTGGPLAASLRAVPGAVDLVAPPAGPPPAAAAVLPPPSGNAGRGSGLVAVTAAVVAAVVVVGVPVVALVRRRRRPARG